MDTTLAIVAAVVALVVVSLLVLMKPEAYSSKPEERPRAQAPAPTLAEVQELAPTKAERERGAEEPKAPQEPSAAAPAREAQPAEAEPDEALAHARQVRSRPERSGDPERSRQHAQRLRGAAREAVRRQKRDSQGAARTDLKRR